MELSARLNGPPHLTGRGLILLCSYRGGEPRKNPSRSTSPGSVGQFLNWVTLLSLRRFIAQHRDHFANPRSTEYQISLAEAVMARGHFSEVDIVVDVPVAQNAEPTAIEKLKSYRVERISAEILARVANRWDTLVIVYPDALGLSWKSLERAAMMTGANVVIVNGRRRLFTLDGPIQRGLTWRRWFATTRLQELLMAVCIIPVAALCAAFDAARGRS